MLKVNGDWVREVKITKMLWQEIMSETLENVSTLLESAEILLNNGGNIRVCSGLYMYAFEEYGKFLLLEKSQPINGEVTVTYKKSFRNHREKFRIALNKLPCECKWLNSAVFDESPFETPIFEEDEIANFDIRNSVFYIDFTMDAKDVKPAPPVDIALLRKAIQRLKDIAAKTKVPE